jgi:molecular chaperone DnaK
MAADNKLLAQFDLVGIPPAPRGVPQVEVIFDIDANGIVSVTAKDKGTGKEHQVRIQSSGGLSDADIEKMVRDAEVNADADKKRRSLVEAKNKAEGEINSAQTALKDYGDKLPEATRSEIEGAITTLKSAVEGENLEKIEESSKDLLQKMMKMGEAVYSSATGHDADAGNDTRTSASGDDVVDAEYEEVGGK